MNTAMNLHCNTHDAHVRQCVKIMEILAQDSIKGLHCPLTVLRHPLNPAII